jgi:hypothetical protein
MLSMRDNTAWKLRSKDRAADVKQNDYELTLWNLQAETGGILGDIAEGVNFVKSNFGMVMSTLAFLRDPLTLVNQSLGLGVGTTSSSRISDPNRRNQLAAMGIKTSAQQEANQSAFADIGNWIGGSAIATFKGTASAFTNVQNSQPRQASLGQVYNQSAYQSGLTSAPGAGATGAGAQAKSGSGSPTGAGAASYEPAYGSQNFAPLVEQQPAASASLSEAYGDTDSDNGTNIAPTTLTSVYGAGSAPSSVRSPAEILAALKAAQNTDLPADEDTKGIQGVDDVDATIDPVI